MNLLDLETRVWAKEEEQESISRFRDGVRSRKGQSSWTLLEQGGCVGSCLGYKQRVLSARFKLGPCRLATGSQDGALCAGILRRCCPQ